MIFRSFLIVFILFISISIKSHAKINLAITVDDIPSSGIDVKGIDRVTIAKNFIMQFDKYKVPKVYGFLNGIQAENMSERLKVLKLWKDSGHFIGNHTYSHHGLSEVSFQKYINDIKKNESLLIDYADTIEELKVFRYPYLQEGEDNKKRYTIRSYLKKRGYRIAQVTIDFQDWLWLEPYARCLESDNQEGLEYIKTSYITFAKETLMYTDQLAKKIWGNKPIPHILLIHMNAVTSKYLGELLSEYSKMGINFVSSKKMIFDKFFDEDTTYTNKNGNNFINQALITRNLKFSSLKSPMPPKQKLIELCK